MRSRINRVKSLLRRPRSDNLKSPASQINFDVFLADGALQINEARLSHLASLDLDLSNKSVLEVGAGIGLHTAFFEERGCTILCTDARPENISELLRRYPHRNAQVLDLDRGEDLRHLGTFDIVYCYGTLYHLSKPDKALEKLSAICNELILIETMVTPGNDELPYFVNEDIRNINQAYSGKGCRPMRPWVMNQLKTNFGFSFTTTLQPCYPDFTRDWLNPIMEKNHRAIFVGSKKPLQNPQLLDMLPDHQQYYFKQKQEIWLDVGAHLGQTTIEFAQRSPWITVYAFEPNLQLAAQQLGKLENFIVIPMAVATHDGFADFYLNVADATSSLLTFNPDELQQWIGGASLRIEKVIKVPTIRLDTFLAAMHITHVDYLKIGTQGSDFEVVQSFGERLHDVKKIKLEVAVTPMQLYNGAHNKVEIVDYLTQKGFVLVNTELQSFGQEENLTFTKQEQQALR